MNEFTLNVALIIGTMGAGFPLTLLRGHLGGRIQLMMFCVAIVLLLGLIASR